jgi:transcriptional activator for dhaKLM operon
MQQSDYPPDLAKLKEAWKHFVTTGQVSPNVDPLVGLSWQRCGPRMNPSSPPQWVYVSDDVLPLTLSQHASLRAIARPIMEDIHQLIKDTSTMLLLLDSTTCVLELLGDAVMREYAAELGTRRGVFLDEGRLGTNAFATALLESCPAQVVGHEHFLRTFHALSSAAAPIFDLDGHPMGAIGLVSMAAQYSPHSLGIAMAAAKAIENQLQADRFLAEANTRATQLNATMDAISEGVLAWTAGDVITYVNDLAGQLLGLNPTSVLGRPLAEHITLPEVLARAVARGEELNDVETSFGVNGAQRQCLVSLRAIRNPEGEPTAFIAMLRRIEQVRQLVNQLVGAQARLTLDGLVGNSPHARQVRRQALAAADAKACILVVGESGTGKNVLARAIHNSGRRASGPFLAINCRAIPRELALSEFLGYEAGTYGAASAGRPSKFELAHGGTLFLEEVESLPLDTQAALLRVIESGDVIRLGGTRVIPVDVRVIASTATNLEAQVAGGTFRSDLRFRLSSFVITLIPLRDRPEDIPLVIERLLDKLRIQVGQTLTVTPQAMVILCAYPWPGNVRELESVMERAVVLCDSQPISVEHLPEGIRQRRIIVPGKAQTEPVQSLSEAEKLAILHAGRSTHGNLTQAADLLGIGRTTLWRKMKGLGLTIDDFRSREHT